MRMGRWTLGLTAGVFLSLLPAILFVLNVCGFVHPFFVEKVGMHSTEIGFLLESWKVWNFTGILIGSMCGVAGILVLVFIFLKPRPSPTPK